MKKLIGLSALLALLFAVPAFAGIVVDETNFPDEGFREVLTKHESYYEEANVIVYPDVTKIDCNKSQSVKDLTGISVFENLEELNCWTCPIQKLDLSGNPKLNYLDVSETKLTSLDVTNNPDLKQLWAYGNAITVLDLSKCPYLSKAVKNGVYNNDKNGGKSYAFADNDTNSYVVVDKKVKILLEDGTVVGPMSGYEDDSGSSGSGGDGSDTSDQPSTPSAVIVAAVNSTNFPDAGFRAVAKTFDTDNDNQLSSEEIEEADSVDCSGRNISSLKGIEYFTEATSLNCSSNKLTALDISRNTNLTRLDCSSNKLTALDVSKNTKLTTLNCSSNKLKTLDISKNTSLNYLDCQSNELTKLDVSKAGSLRAAVLKGRHSPSDENYDYFKDPHYMNVTIYVHGSPGGGRSIDLSYYLYVDKFVTVKAAGVTNKASADPPASIAPPSSSGNTGKTQKPAASKTVATVGNGKYKLAGSVAVLTGPKDKKITKLTIPATVKIGGKARKVTKIAANAFKGCGKLTAIAIGKNVTTIGAGAFSGCKNLTRVTIGPGVKTIGKTAFLNCSKLKTITIKTSKLTVKTVGANAFKGINAKAKIKVPKAKLKIYTALLKKKGIGKNVKITR